MLKYLLIFSSLLFMASCTVPQTTSASINNELVEQPNRADTSVTIYQEGDNTIEEKRVKGFLYSLKVIPKKGKPYYLINANGDNNTLQNSSPQQKIPEWTIFSW